MATCIRHVTLGKVFITVGNTQLCRARSLSAATIRARVVNFVMNDLKALMDGYITRQTFYKKLIYPDQLNQYSIFNSVFNIELIMLD